jgi:metal-sulfur cluster biosynthetic enzyme
MLLQRHRSVVTEEAVWQALASVTDAMLGQSLVDLGMVQSVRVVRDGRVAVQLTVPSPHWPRADELVGTARSAIASLPGVAAVSVQLTDDPPWTPYRLSAVLRAPLGLSADEPPSPFVLAPSASSRVRQRLRRLLSR